MGLHVHADLDVEVDGIRARLVDDGPDLVLETDRPVALLRAIGPEGLATLHRRAGAAGPASAIALRLSDPMHLRLRGPYGDVAVLRASPDDGRRLSVTPARLISPRSWKAIAVLVALGAWVSWGGGLMPAGRRGGAGTFAAPLH